MKEINQFITEKLRINKSTKVKGKGIPEANDKIVVYHKITDNTVTLHVAKVKKFYGNTFTVTYEGMSNAESSKFLDHTFEIPKKEKLTPFFATSTNIKDLAMDKYTFEEELDTTKHSDDKNIISGFRINNPALTATEYFGLINKKLEE